jgi:flagellar FliJ protein
MLKDLAEKRRDACTLRLGKVLAATQEAKARLQLLLDYRTDYQGRLERAAHSGIKGEQLRNYQSFLANLERAVEQQTNTVAVLEEDVLRVRGEIAAEQRQIESYAVLLRRRAKTQATRETRSQQALQDEFASNSVIRLASQRDRGGDD